jgi:cytochrome c oxidase assembly protein subunit 15
MVHRYFAAALGLMILAIAVLGWKLRREAAGSPVLPTMLLGLVIFQGLLGMWTVTLLLKPVIVTAHLLGGMATLSLLLWLWLRERVQSSHVYFARIEHLRLPATLALLLVIAQIALGGWVSTNYAALACTDFPLCQGRWVPQGMDFEHAFTLRRELGETAGGELLTMASLTAIHWVHRVMALIVFVYVGWLAIRLLRTPGYVCFGMAVGGLLCVQVALGISNVLFSLPLWLAVAHNAGAAFLLAGVVWLNHRVRRT